ncbi:MAG: transcriptional regulator [Rhodoferax sp.]|nr:transcriptional regulator [Rhodoferax sp.]
MGAQAQSPSPPARTPAGVSAPGVADRGLSDWLMRMHEASRKRAYIGTFVVSAGGSMSSARIWHVCDGEQQMERVETLTGAPRSTFRRNDQVVTFFPETRVAVAERRETLGLFPNLLQSADSAIARHYTLRPAGTDRVAGVEADVVELQPKDALRFGYRIWSERKSGLVVKLQTLAADSQVLEQAAFSELQLDAPVSMARLSQLMGNTEGWQVERPGLVRTTAAAAGWALRTPVPGFEPTGCYLRPVTAGPDGRREDTLQWLFSDGLATVSLFIEPLDPRRHGQPGAQALGATQVLMRRVADSWLTAVGEVPQATLAAFAQALERRR